MKARIPLIAALAVAVLPLKASAQAWVSNPDFAEGIGIRTGNFEWHPSAAAEFGYDSNYFRASAREGKVEVLRLRVTPSFTVGSLSSARRNSLTRPDVVFGAGAHLSYNEIIPLDSTDSEASKQRNFAAGVDARVNVFPQRKVGFDLTGAWVRAIEPNGTSDDLAGEGFNRGTFRGGAGVTWRPGGGQFEWRLGYGITYNYFENAAYNSFANLHHDIGTRGRWRFLPRSALLFDAGYSFVRYTDNATQQNDGDAVHARVGFHGLVTYHLSLLGMVGWASSFYKPRTNGIAARQFDSVIANAEARWFLQATPNLDAASITSGLSSVALGYSRTFSNSYYGSFYQSDRGYLQFSMFLLGAVVGGVEFGVSRVAFPEVERGTFQQASFSQSRLDGRLFGEYRFTDTIASNLTVQYDKVNSDPINGEDLDYDRWQAFIGVRVFW
jgi:hypothetical protein